MSGRVGLTGGIGSGKSTVARMFAAQGIPVIDADRISRQLTAAGGSALSALQAAFGGEIIDTASGGLNRTAMRRLMLENPDARGTLENILHPLILQEIVRFQAACNAPYSIAEIPLLIELPQFRATADRVLLVDTPQTQQIARAGERGGIGADEIRKIIALQASRTQRLAAADDVITNNGSLAQLATQVLTQDQFYRRFFS